MLKKRGRSTASKSCVIYSDIHVGSRTAVCSTDPVLNDADTSYRPNPLQKALYEGWESVIDEFQQKPRVLVINGEPINGSNRRFVGKDSYTTNLVDQLDEAEKLINQIPKDHLLFVRGSPYHVDIEATNFEELLAKRLNADRYRAFGKIDAGGYTDYFAKFEMHGKYFHCTHHIGWNRWFAYRGTALMREMAAMHFDKERSTVGKVDVYVRSHVHYFVNVNFVHTHGFINPAWKFPDGYLYRGGAGGIYPDIGCVEVIVESNGEILIAPHVYELKLPARVLHY